MRRSFTVVSIVAHSVVIAAALLVQVVADGALPTPHRPVLFDSSAFMPVSDMRGPTNTNLAIDPSWPPSKACARAKPFWKDTGDSHVSRKSAPNESTYFALAKS